MRPRVRRACKRPRVFRRANNVPATKPTPTLARRGRPGDARSVTPLSTRFSDDRSWSKTACDRLGKPGRLGRRFLGRPRGTAMKFTSSLSAIVCLGLATAASAGTTVTGLHGQDSATAASDQSQCSSQATQQTGFNPSQPPPPPATASPYVAGSGTRARGAATGAMIGGVSGNAGAGAAAGAVAGGVVQRSRNRQAARQTNAAVAQQQGGRTGGIPSSLGVLPHREGLFGAIAQPLGGDAHRGSGSQLP
jgi:hypothetical protein